VEGLRILGPLKAEERISVFSFVFKDFSAVDLVQALDRRGIAIRGGDLAALPLLKRMGVTAAARASLYHYTQASEIDVLAQALEGLRRGKPRMMSP
jgi:cysteine desulfurase / selenocysteine lyase